VHTFPVVYMQVWVEGLHTALRISEQNEGRFMRIVCWTEEIKLEEAVLVWRILWSDDQDPIFCQSRSYSPCYPHYSLHPIRPGHGMLDKDTRR
jgi:hypothetical protein